MRQPPDQFAEYLRDLRKTRGWTADRLSLAVGMGKNYLGHWERGERRTIDRDLLLKLAQVLELTDTEKRKLFRLADLRHTPNGARELYGPEVNPEETLLEALLEIDHDAQFPTFPTDAHSAYGGAFVRAAGAVLALLTGTKLDLFLPYTSIRWPKPLARLGIVPRPDDKTTPLDIPESILRCAFPRPESLKVLGSPSPDERAKYSIFMARLYTSLLFSDLDRARQVAATLQHWKYTCESDTALRLSLRFKVTDLHEIFGVDDVDWEVVWRCNERSLAHGLWTTHAARRGIAQVRKNPWLCQWRPQDWAVLMTIVWTLTGGPRDEDPTPAIRDAIYTLRSHSWPNVQVAIGDKFPLDHSVAAHLQRQLSLGQLEPDMAARLRAEPWLIAGVHPDLLLAHLRTFCLMAVRPKQTQPSEAAQATHRDRSTDRKPKPGPAKSKRAVKVEKRTTKKPRKRKR